MRASQCCDYCAVRRSLVGKCGDTFVVVCVLSKVKIVFLGQAAEVGLPFAE